MPPRTAVRDATKPVRLPAKHVTTAEHLAVTLTAREGRVVTERETLARATEIGLAVLATEPAIGSLPTHTSEPPPHRAA